MPAREPGSSKSPTISKIAQSATSAGQFVSARERGSSKGPGISEIAQSATSAGHFVLAKRTQVE